MFACRYGKQQLSEVERWPLAKLQWFVDELNVFLEAEGGDGSSDVDEGG